MEENAYSADVMEDKKIRHKYIDNVRTLDKTSIKT